MLGRFADAVDSGAGGVAVAGAGGEEGAGAGVDAGC